ncbi:MAG: glycosyltransferase family 2 protein [Niveispirillum sp.]|uniref:glycosyltransferase family 2 protein n=1 Tax=Niveispirillum sp. TaxID=1917217 RepID=UPI003BA7AE56
MVPDLPSPCAVALSIVVPVYGSATILPELVQRISAALAADPDLNGRTEAIFVCDASPDDSWRVMQRLAAEYPFLTCLRLRRNVGQHPALLAGLRLATGRVVVTMDDDLQHAPDDIPALYRTVMAGADVCYVRYARQRHATWKRWGSRFNDAAAVWLLGKPKNLYLSSFRALDRVVVDEITRFTGPFVYLDGLILAAAVHIETVALEHHPRREGAGGYGLKKSVALWAAMATGFSIAPLRLSLFLGMAAMAAGSLAAALLIGIWLKGGSVDGSAALIVVASLLAGAQLAGLGFIGEYLGRLSLAVNGKPQYVVAETVGARRRSPSPVAEDQRP